MIKKILCWIGWCPTYGRPKVLDEALNKTKEEAIRATKKFPEWPTDPLHALAILGEEFGELGKDVLQLTYEPEKTNLEAMRNEAVQTAAMAIRFLMSIDEYEFKQSTQHVQG